MGKRMRRLSLGVVGAIIIAFGLMLLATAGSASSTGVNPSGTAAVHKSASANQPPGNNGTIKIDGVVFDDQPNNEPHVCIFQVDWYAFDANVVSHVTFAVHPPTGNQVILTDDVQLDNDDASGGGSVAGLDGSRTYDLSALLANFTPQPQQGYHVELTTDTPGSIGADVKHKEFWVHCETPPTTTSPPTTTPVTTTTSTSTTTMPVTTTVPVTTSTTTVPVTTSTTTTTVPVTTTVPETTPTTVPVTTTPPTTVPPTTPPTTVPPTSAQPTTVPPTTATPPTTTGLPFTGSSHSGPMTGAGLALVVLGAAMMFGSRRRNSLV